MEKNKNIIILAGYKALYGGNFIPSLLNLEKHLLEQGASSIFVFPPSAKERDWCKQMIEKGSTILFLDPDFSKIKQVAKLIHWVKLYKCGIVYTHFSQYDIIASICSHLNNNFKLFMHVHSDFTGFSDSSNEKIKFKSYIRNCIIGRKATIVCVSNHLRQYYLKLGIKENKCVYIPNGLSNTRLARETIARDELRLKLSLSSEQILVLSFGWETHIKGVDIGVESIRIARNSNPNLSLGIVIGKNFDDKKKWIDYINKNTNCTGKEEWIIYLKQKEDVFSYHNASDFMLSSSRSEGFSYTILEALSIGKPVISSNLKGTKWAQKYKLTHSFTSENVNECAYAILDAVEQTTDKEYELIRIETMNEILNEYSINTWCEKISEVFLITNK